MKTIPAAAALRLVNTPAVCRKSYVHPALINLTNARERPVRAKADEGLDEAEATFLALIRPSLSAGRGNHPS